MIKVTERQRLILDKTIQEYINSARPVSSQLLEKKHKFGICPATIRIEMQKLTDKGFLAQPHTSAGRVPTDKGYRFFVDGLLEKEILEFEDVLGTEEMLQGEGKDVFRFIAQLSKFLATTSSNLAAIYLLEKDFFWKEGWEEIIKEPEFAEKDFISDFAKFLKSFEEEIKDFKVNSEIKIYIGQENPFVKTKNFSIITARCCFPNKEEGTISLLGPKRMAYQKNISLVSSIAKFLKDF